MNLIESDIKGLCYDVTYTRFQENYCGEGSVLPSYINAGMLT